MKKNLFVVAIALSVTSIVAMADEEKIDYSLTVKSWHNAINVANKDDNITTQAANGPIIGITAKKGDYFVTASTMLESSYRYTNVWLARKDVDFAFGYRYNQNVSLIVGHKTLYMKDGSYTDWLEKHAGVYLGVAGFKLLNDATFVYGNLSYAPSMSSSGTSSIDVTNSAKFTTYEAGLGYTLSNSSQLTIGYRSQQAKDYNVTKSRSQTATMKGIIAGVNINF
jgi:hypothetical protein